MSDNVKPLKVSVGTITDIWAMVSLYPADENRKPDTTEDCLHVFWEDMNKLGTPFKYLWLFRSVFEQLLIRHGYTVINPYEFHKEFNVRYVRPERVRLEKLKHIFESTVEEGRFDNLGLGDAIYYFEQWVDEETELYDN